MEKTWLAEDRLCCWAGDTIRAELSPRRVAPTDDGFEVVTPEQALALEQNFLTDYRRAEADGAPLPSKKDYVFVDNQARHFPKVWKLYRLVDSQEKDKDGNLITVKRFARVGTVETIDEAQAFVENLGA